MLGIPSQKQPGYEYYKREGSIKTKIFSALKALFIEASGGNSDTRQSDKIKFGNRVHLEGEGVFRPNRSSRRAPVSENVFSFKKNQEPTAPGSSAPLRNRDKLRNRLLTAEVAKTTKS